MFNLSQKLQLNEHLLTINLMVHLFPVKYIFFMFNVERRKTNNEHRQFLEEATALGPGFKVKVHDEAVWTRLENAAVAFFSGDKACSHCNCKTGQLDMCNAVILL